MMGQVYTFNKTEGCVAECSHRDECFGQTITIECAGALCHIAPCSNERKDIFEKQQGIETGSFVA